ncbi:uncharacterized protein LOC141619806 [Silene latifolia]|uniref:uncharacterized protein LOC141619806 n=1 Tax=Silene latifolia TaxID=37657 RepID=UPI003D789A49
MESVGGKRKIDEEIELAKQKAQAIAARLISDAAVGGGGGGDTKRPRTTTTDATPDYSSSSSTVAAAVSYTPMTNNNINPSSQKISIPNAKVGVIIGRGGDMIKNLQARSGARIQITRDNDADPCALTRDVELMGTPDQIARAQHLITETIAEADAASSGPSGNRVPLPPLQSGAQQFVIKVPNDKVALVIGKGGETIKTMQSTSGARIQVVPLHLPPGDTSTERNVYINGTQDQIDSAKELVNEVISGNRLKVLSATNAYTHPAYAATTWTPPGQPPAQQPPAYGGYTQPATYAVPPPPYYAGYPPHQTNTPQHHSTGYNTYGQPLPASAPPSMAYNYGQMPSTAGYNYNQAYPQQPLSYGQDISGQVQPPDQSKPFTNSAYGPPATSGQPDGSGYGGPVVSGQPDGSVAQSQPPPAYATGYDQATPAQPNGGSAFPTYSGAPLVQPPYSQTGYPQTAYGQQQEGQVANQASYSYYGQSGYPPPAQASYYQDAYPAVTPPQAPPQIQPQGTNGVPQPSSYGVEKTDGGGAAAADEKEKPQS